MESHRNLAFCTIATLDGIGRDSNFQSADNQFKTSCLIKKKKKSQMKLLILVVALLATTLQTFAIKQEFKVIPFNSSVDTWNVTAGCYILWWIWRHRKRRFCFDRTRGLHRQKDGGEFTLTSSYSLSEEVSSGKANYKASLNGLPVVNQNDDLCTDLKSGPTPCPLAKGPHKSKISKALPDSVPAGTFVAQQSWTTDDGRPILCLKYKITVQG